MSSKEPSRKRIYIVGEQYEFPYSRGLLAQSLLVTGIDVRFAYIIAEEIRKELENIGKDRITEEELDQTVHNVLMKKASVETAKRYTLTRKLGKLKEPLIILVGGSTGVGKSTLSVMLAHRLGLRNVIGTDVIRQVLRKVISPDLIPALHVSSYHAWKSLSHWVPPTQDKIIVGFEEQAKHIIVGLEAVIERALTEGSSIIIEGIHVVPRLMSKKLLKSKNVIIVFITVGDEEEHLNRLRARSHTVVIRRPIQRYLDYFPHIRRIDEYLIDQAEMFNFPVIETSSIMRTLNQLLKVVSDRIEKIVEEEVAITD